MENLQVQQALADSLLTDQCYRSEKSFSTFPEFLKCMEKHKDSLNSSERWIISEKKEEVLFFLITKNPIPKIEFSVVVDNTCTASVFSDSLTICTKKLQTINDLDEILENTLKNKPKEISQLQFYASAMEDILKKMTDLVKDEQARLLKFISEQFKLMLQNPSRYRYSTDLIILASIFFSISPHAYKFVRNSRMIILPHPQTIKKICAKYETNPIIEQNDANFLKYVRNRFNCLEEKERLVILLLDEIHVKPMFDFKGGNIVGAAYNSEMAAKTAFVFMIKSLLSDYKEVAHILPVCRIEAEQLYLYIRKIITGLHSIGYNVICVVSDNNAINRKSMSFFHSPPELKISYNHPCTNDMPLFYLFDTVHIFKCIRNNWVNKKDEDQTIQYPPFNCVSGNEPDNCLASFVALKNLYTIEETMLVKHAYSLTFKSLFPSNLERQNVKYVLNIFHQSVREGLLHYGEDKKLANYQSTADFVNIVIDWWSAVNVKTVYKGIRRRNPLEHPLLINNDPYKYLALICDWLNRWNACGNRNGLTKETFTAFKHSTEALLQITRFCVENLHFSYILPGIQDKFCQLKT